MKFEKPSVSIPDQIALLEARGMAVPDHAHAAHCLQNISYYRLRAYWLPFEDAPQANGEHGFRARTSVGDVLELYIFDRRLRLLVMDAIKRIEVSLRGSWAHHLAMKYGPHGYLDPALYHCRVESMVAGLRQIMTSVFEASNLLEQQRQGAITRQLAACAAILAVPMAIAGIYGMNLKNMPELETRYGYFVVLGVIAVLCTVLYVRFKKSGWL